MAKYFSILVDGTPDSNHTELTNFILRYLKREGDFFCIQEQLLAFVDYCNRTRADIASLTLDTI